jgi:hypothetical protein
VSRKLGILNASEIYRPAGNRKKIHKYIGVNVILYFIEKGKYKISFVADVKYSLSLTCILHGNIANMQIP